MCHSKEPDNLVNAFVSFPSTEKQSAFVSFVFRTRLFRNQIKASNCHAVSNLSLNDQLGNIEIKFKKRKHLPTYTLHAYANVD